MTEVAVVRLGQLEGGLLMASGRDPQGFVLDHLKFVQMGGGYLSEPDGSAKFRMGNMMALYLATRVSIVKPQLDPARAFMTLRALDTRSTQSRA